MGFNRMPGCPFWLNAEPDWMVLFQVFSHFIVTKTSPLLFFIEYSTTCFPWSKQDFKSGLASSNFPHKLQTKNQSLLIWDLNYILTGRFISSPVQSHSLPLLWHFTVNESTVLLHALSGYTWNGKQVYLLEYRCFRFTSE